MNRQQPQATTRCTSQRERDNTAPPAEHDAARTTPHDSPHTRATQHSIPRQNTTTGHERGPGNGNRGQQHKARTRPNTRTPRTTRQNTKHTTQAHRNTAGKNAHRTGTTREHPTTQQKRTPAPAGAQRPQQHTPAHPTTKDKQTGTSTAQPAHQGRKKKRHARKKRRGNQQRTGAPQKKGGALKERKRKARGGDHRAPWP